MHISMLEIENFRGLNIKLSNVKDVVTIIGQNDSGKSNICQAILKVLDYNKRKIPFQESDSTLSNWADITITIKFDVNSLDNDQLAILHEVIHDEVGEKYLFVKLISKYNSDVLLYEDQLFIGDMEQDFKEYNISRQNPIDKVLSVIYKPHIWYKIGNQTFLWI